MKRVLAFLGLLVVGGLIIWGGVAIFNMPHRSNVAMFYIIWVSFIPIPIPIALFTSPHFWGGLVCLLGLGVAGAGFAQFKD